MKHDSYKEYLDQRRWGIKLMLSVDPFITAKEIAILENGSTRFGNGSLAGKISRIKVTIRNINKTK